MLTRGEIIREPGYENLRITDCDRFLNKFKRAILPMISVLQKQRTPGIVGDKLIDAEKQSIFNRLTNVGVNDDLKNGVIQSLYS